MVGSISTTIYTRVEHMPKYSIIYSGIVGSDFRINNSQLVKLMTDDDMPNIATLFPPQNGSIC